MGPYKVYMRLGKRARRLRPVKEISVGLHSTDIDLGPEEKALTFSTADEALKIMQKAYTTGPGRSYTIKDSKGRVYYHVGVDGAVKVGKAYRDATGDMSHSPKIGSRSNPRNGFSVLVVAPEASPLIWGAWKADLAKQGVQVREVRRGVDGDEFKAVYLFTFDKSWTIPKLKRWLKSKRYKAIAIGEKPSDLLDEGGVMRTRKNQRGKGKASKKWTVWAEYGGRRYVYSHVPGQPKVGSYSRDFYAASNTAVPYDSRLEAERAALMLLSTGQVASGADMLVKSPSGTFFYAVERAGRKGNVGKSPIIGSGDKAMIEHMVAKYVKAHHTPEEAIIILRGKMKAGAWDALTPAQKRAVTAHIQKTQKANTRLYQSVMGGGWGYTGQRKNPEGAAVEVLKRSRDREAEGKARAKAAEADIRAKMDPDRFQPTWALKNMIKALEIGPWQNTVADWQRYYEAKYILRLRRSRRRR